MYEAHYTFISGGRGSPPAHQHRVGSVNGGYTLGAFVGDLAVSFDIVTWVGIC